MRATRHGQKSYCAWQEAASEPKQIGLRFADDVATTLNMRHFVTASYKGGQAETLVIQFLTHHVSLAGTDLAPLCDLFADGKVRWFYEFSANTHQQPAAGAPIIQRIFCAPQHDAYREHVGWAFPAGNAQPIRQ